MRADELAGRLERHATLILDLGGGLAKYRAADLRAAAEALRAQREAAKDLDKLLLRLAFDAGGIGDEKVGSLGIDPWGVLADFRAAFDLAPTMTPEEWTKAALGAQEEKHGDS